MDVENKAIKIDIKDYEVDPIEVINKVKIKQFRYSNDTKKKIGFLTEETPEPLTDSTHKKFETGNCISLLIMAVQDLTKRIEVLENASNAVRSK